MLFVAPFLVAVALIWIPIGFVYWIPRLGLSIVALMAGMLGNAVSGGVMDKLQVQVDKGLTYYIRGFGIILGPLRRGNEPGNETAAATGRTDEFEGGFLRDLASISGAFIVRTVVTVVFYVALALLLWKLDIVPLSTYAPIAAFFSETADDALRAFDRRDTEQISSPRVEAESVPASDTSDSTVEPPRIDYTKVPSPVYPQLSIRLAEEGKVHVRVYVGVDGRPRRARVVRSSGHDRLDQAAVEAARQYRFVPGTRHGRRAAMWHELQISFRLHGGTN